MALSIVDTAYSGAFNVEGLALPGTPQAGDRYVIIALGVTDNAAGASLGLTAPTGYTLHTSRVGSAGGSAAVSIWSKLWQSGDGTTIDVDWTTTTDAKWMFVFAYLVRSTIAGNYVDYVSAASSSGANSGTTDTTAGFSHLTGDVLIAAHCNDNKQTVYGPWSKGVTLTEDYEVTLGSGGPTNYSSAGAASTVAVGGSSSGFSVTHDDELSRYSMVGIALREANPIALRSVRWRNDDGSESAATWYGATDEKVAITPGGTKRLRALLEAYVTGVDPADGSALGEGYVVQVQKNFGAWVTLTNTPLTDGPYITTSTFVTDESLTTQQLGAGTFRAGFVDENGDYSAANRHDVVGWSAGEETELEFVIAFGADIKVSDVFLFRVAYIVAAAVVPLGLYDLYGVAGAGPYPAASGFSSSSSGSGYVLTALNAWPYQSGDLVLVSIIVDNWGTWMTPSGWTLLGTGITGTDLHIKTYYRIFDGTETSATFNWGTTAEYALFYDVINGAHPSTPIDDSDFSGSNNTQIQNSVTTTGPDRLLYSPFGLLHVSGLIDTITPQDRDRWRGNGALIGRALSYYEKAAAGAQTVIATNDIGILPMVGATVAIRPPAGGTTYQESATDTLGLTDSAIDVLTGVRSITDPAGLADTITAIANAVRSITDPAGLTDTLDYRKIVTRALADDAGLTDTLDALLTAARSITDPAGLADTLTRVAAALRTISDAANLTDTLDAVTAAVRSITDPAGLADTLTFRKILAKTLTDAAGVTDTLNRVSTSSRTLTDPAGLTDLLTAAAGIARTLTDAAGLADTLETLSTASRTLTDTAGLLDTLTYRKILAELLTDAANLTDTLEDVLTASRTLTDPAGLTDVLAIVRSSSRSLTDAANLTDTLDARILIARIISEAAGLTDTVTAVLTAIRSITDAAGLADTLNAVLTIVRSMTDVAGVTDTLEIVRSSSRTPIDPAGLADTLEYVLTAAGTLLRTVTDTLSLTDTLDLVAAAYRATTDPAGLADTLNAVSAAIRSAGVDPLGLTDALAWRLILTTTAQDDAGLTDALTYVLALARDLTDPAGLTDTLERALTASRTLTDPAGLTDLLVSSLGATRSAGVDPLGLTDTLAAIIRSGTWHRDPIAYTADPITVTYAPVSYTPFREDTHP